MPLFSIVCESCAAETEVLQRGGQELLCPACGSAQVSKLLSHFAPLQAATQPAGCGATQCCMMQGGCPN